MGKREEMAEYILKRHKEAIEREEVPSLSRLRQLISPYSEYVSNLKAKILESLAPYKKEKKFMDAVERVISHCSSIEVVKLPVQYTLSFEEMEGLQAGPRIGKAVLTTSLLRAMGSETAACIIGNKYVLVKFRWMNQDYAIDVEKNSLLKEERAEKFIRDSQPRYIFNDLFFEFGEKS